MTTAKLQYLIVMPKIDDKLLEEVILEFREDDGLRKKKGQTAEKYLSLCDFDFCYINYK